MCIRDSHKALHLLGIGIFIRNAVNVAVLAGDSTPGILGYTVQDILAIDVQQIVQGHKGTLAHQCLELVG